MEDPGSFDPILDASRWPANGRLLLRLQQLLARPASRHDLICELRRRDGRWDRECIAEARSFNGELHELSVQREDEGRTWRLKGIIKPDPWVVLGGPCTVVLHLDDDGTGTYQADLAGQAVSGAVTTEFQVQARPSRGVASPTLRILAEPSGRLWDFSHAGRDRGAPVQADQALPVIAAADHGVKADSGEECAPGLRAAIAAAAALGGAVVQLPAGTLDYRVDGWQPPIVIAHPRIVIRGAGSGPGGTLLVNHRYADHAADPKKPWLAGRWPIFRFEGSGPSETPAQMGTDAARSTTERSTPVAHIRRCQRGSTELELEPGHEVRPGTTYLLVHEEAEGLPLITSLIGDACVPASGYRQPGAPRLRHFVTVQEVQGGTAVLDAPVHWTRKDSWPAQLWSVAMLEDVGIGNLRLRGHWDGYFNHHKNPEHDNGWDQVHFSWCERGFVSDLVHENCTTALGLSNCHRCTVDHLRVTGNPGHNGICLGGSSTACLLRHCDINRQMHAINLSGSPCGNVIHDCRIDEPGGLDLHGSNGLDNLVDRLTGGVLVGGGSPAHVPPRHAPGLVLWNWAQGHYHPYKAWRRVRRLADWRDTPGFIAIGVHAMDGHLLFYHGPDGDRCEDRCDDRAWVESLNQAVAPRSLYLWQCKKSEGR